MTTGRYTIEYTARVFRNEHTFQKLRKRAFFSVKKHIEGKGITFIPADGEIAVDQAIAELWERKGYIDRKRLQLFNDGETVPVIAFVAQRARSRYYDTFRKGHAKGHALTDLIGVAKLDRAIEDVAFWQSVKLIDSQQVREIIRFVHDGWTIQEIGEMLHTSHWNVRKIIDRKVKPALCALDTDTMSR